MVKQMLRYGLVLGVLLGLFEFLRRANAVRILNEQAYLGIIALVFLIGGFVLAWSFAKGQNKRARRGPAKVGNNLDLSGRERDVLSYLVHGYTNAEIAQSLGVTQNTVKTHIKNLFQKLDVSNRTEAAAEAKILGIME
ncbi:response regulator transcription factor [Maritalea sp.]|uniref:response regulator transcription factor n=1 Tax=Maritalea sp. TaxID=2003361 RepID=UPI003EF310C1